MFTVIRRYRPAALAGAVLGLVLEIGAARADLEAAPTVPAAEESRGLTSVRPAPPAGLELSILEGARLKVGAQITLKVRSPAAGLLVILAESPDGTVRQLYPSLSFPAPGADPKIARVTADKPLEVPSSQQILDGYRIVLKPPTGHNRLRALVLADTEAVKALIRANSDGHGLRDLDIVSGAPEPSGIPATGGGEVIASGDADYDIIE